MKIEIIPQRLYWLSQSHPPKHEPNAFYICIDKELVYEPFNQDFGPLNLAMTCKFTTHLHRLLQQYTKATVYHYTSSDPQCRANAAVLIGAYQIFYLGRSAVEAWRPIAEHYHLIGFRDASAGVCHYECTVLHCLQAFERVIGLGWFSPTEFDCESYEQLERIGDFNWVIPRRFLAFSDPDSVKKCSLSLKKLGVKTVVRLNEKTYDELEFTKNGIKVHDLFFPDGSCPSIGIVNRFIKIKTSEKGPVAVHCKAGLGRTGTLIACYAIRKFQFPAVEMIAWCRLCRPGSILGPQQIFLVEFQNSALFRYNKAIYSTIDSHIAKKGEKDQGKRLLSAKKRNIEKRDDERSANEAKVVKKSSSKRVNVNRCYTPALRRS